MNWEEGIIVQPVVRGRLCILSQGKLSDKRGKILSFAHPLPFTKESIECELVNGEYGLVYMKDVPDQALSHSDRLTIILGYVTPHTLPLPTHVVYSLKEMYVVWQRLTQQGFDFVTLKISTKNTRPRIFKTYFEDTMEIVGAKEEDGKVIWLVGQRSTPIIPRGDDDERRKKFRVASKYIGHLCIVRHLGMVDGVPSFATVISLKT